MEKAFMYFFANEKLTLRMRYLRYLVINERSYQERSTNKIMSCDIEKRPESPYKSL